MTWRFYVPLIVAYLVACGGWLAGFRLTRGWWPPRRPLETDEKWLDLAMVAAAGAMIFGLGWVYRQGWLAPQPDGWAGDLMWQVNNLIIYAPILLVLAHRRQSLRTVFFRPAGFPVKLAAGLVLGTLSVAVFVLLRGQPGRLPLIAVASVQPANMRNFLPVFLEGVALAFAYVRLRWAFGMWPALIAPSLLFAAAHIPRQLDSGLPASEMVTYFIVTSVVAFAVLFTLDRSRDVIWLGIVHYLMDIAIGAFQS